MCGVEYVQPLLKQVRWKAEDVLITGHQSGGGGRVSSLRGPYGSLVTVRMVAAPPRALASQDRRYGPVLDQLKQSGEPGVVPFVWAHLAAAEVGFLTEARPSTPQHLPGLGLGFGLLQLLGIIQTLRDCGAEVQQLSPDWLLWNRGSLPCLVDLRWLVTESHSPCGYWTHPGLLRGRSGGNSAVRSGQHKVDTAVWSAIQLALAHYPDDPGAAQCAALLETSCAMPEVLTVVFRVIGLPEIADGEPALAGSPSSFALPRWNYSPSSASKSPASRRRFTSVK